MVESVREEEEADGDSIWEEGDENGDSIWEEGDENGRRLGFLEEERTGLEGEEGSKRVIEIRVFIFWYIYRPVRFGLGSGFVGPLPNRTGSVLSCTGRVHLGWEWCGPGGPSLGPGGRFQRAGPVIVKAYCQVLK